jgi:hypothetical protein
MKKIKFTDAEREAVFQIVAAVLHLGNINYIPVTFMYNNAEVLSADIENPTGTSLPPPTYPSIISLPSSLPSLPDLHVQYHQSSYWKKLRCN